MSDDENPITHDGESLTFPMTSSALRRNGHIVIKGRPCKIVDMSTSKTGKHGHAKIHFVGIDIFTGKKLEDVVPSTYNSDVPSVHKEEYQLDGVDNDHGYLLLKDMNGNTKNDIAVPEGDIGQQVMEYGDSAVVTILSAMNEAACIAIKSGK